MGTPLFITLVSVVVVGIAWAIDFPMTAKTMWILKYPRPRKRKLWEILREAQGEVKTQARTFTEELEGMQDRTQAQTERRTSRRYSPLIR